MAPETLRPAKGTSFAVSLSHQESSKIFVVFETVEVCCMDLLPAVAHSTLDYVAARTSACFLRQVLRSIADLVEVAVVAAPRNRKLIARSH